MRRIKGINRFKLYLVIDPASGLEKTSIVAEPENQREGNEFYFAVRDLIFDFNEGLMDWIYAEEEMNEKEI